MSKKPTVISHNSLPHTTFERTHYGGVLRFGEISIPLGILECNRLLNELDDYLNPPILTPPQKRK